MLVLSRRCEQSIVIGPDITITVTRLSRHRCKLAIQAPLHLRIARAELPPIDNTLDDPWENGWHDNRHERSEA